MASQHTLSLSDIKKLVGVTQDVFRFIEDLKVREPIARHIKNIQIPSLLTESLALLLLERHHLLSNLQHYTFSRVSGAGADLLAVDTLPPYGRMTLEVKATGIKGFQRLGQNDMACAYLLWIHIHEIFAGRQNMKFTVYIIPKPDRFFHSGQEVFVTDLPKMVGSELQTSTWKLDDL